jgi:hypothetical protein
MCKLKIPLIIQSLVFLIPINYYVIGQGMANGVQWALFRYQQDILGNNFYSITSDFLAVISGGLQGERALAVILWTMGTSLLVGCFCLQLLILQKKKPGYGKWIAITTVISGLIFLLSDVVQYGLLFHGAGGFCIPIGIPIIIVMGWLAYRYEDSDIFFNSETPESNKARIINELVLIVFISIFVKIIVFSISMFPAIVWVHQDVTLYYHYMQSAISGKIPYIDYMIEYPQFFLIPVFIAAIPSLILQNSSVYFHSFMILMYLFDTATLICVYFIALKLFGQKKALLCSLLYATAFSSAFLVSLTYDSFPTFLLMFSILVFLYGKEVPAYISAAAGTMAKWFPVFCFPYFVLYTIKNKKETESLKKGIIISFVIIFLSVIPLILLNYQAFLRTYLFHFGRGAYFPSFIYYLDVISKYFFNSELFVNLSLVVMAFVECALIYWYYKYLDGKQSTLCYLIFLSVFCFILLNKVFAPYYIVWITPFLALFFINSIRQIVLFYVLQFIVYLEEPILMERVANDYSFAGPSILIHPDLFDPFVFYSVKFVIFFVVLYVILQDLRKSQCIEKNVKINNDM